ncbi:Transcriptional regulator [Rhodotorula kratochvilovae]
MAPPPVPAPPPAASASPSNELRRFNVPPAPPPNAPLTACASGSGPIPSSELAKLRASLTLSRIVAADRSACVDGNRRIVGERSASDRRAAAAEETKARDAERDRKRKRDEDDRRERAERDRAAKDEERRRAAEKAQKSRVKQQEEEDRRGRESREKQRALDVLSLVQANEAQRRHGDDADGDTPMGDASTSTSAAATPSSAATPSAKVPSKGARPLATSPDPDDEPVQPKPPRHHDKKKRKRDQVVESDNSDTDDDRPLLQKVRTLDSISESSPSVSFTPQYIAPSASTSQHLPHQNGSDALSTIERKLKEERFTKHSIPIKPPAPGAATAFYVPSVPLVPPRPPAVPPPPTPKRQADVSGDFSNAKPGQQIAHSTFTNWVDAYLRPFGEDDLAFLAPKPEDMNAYLIPPLGKHYLDRWEDEDGDAHHAQQQGWRPSPLEPPVLPRLRPDALTEDALGGESVFLGPLSERLVAALAVEPGAPAGDRSEDAEGDGPPQPRLQMDAVDLEERVKRELRYLGVLPEEEVDWSAREDDEISSALRACQRLLHQQTELNEARKSVLMSLVKDRMAYQDYETARDAQERVIEAGWTKRTRTDGKKKKKGKERDRRPGAPQPPSDDPSKAPISAELAEAVEKRDRLVAAFKPFFEEDGAAARFFGLPDASVYDGLEALVDDELGEGQEGQAAGLEAGAMVS